MSDIKRKVGTFTDEELKELERVYIEDGTGKKTVAGLGSGIACIVGEFLKGPVNVPTLVTTDDDIESIFGTWSIYSNPGFENLTGSIDPSLSEDITEGNGYFRVKNAKYASLYILRVDDSVATCTLTLSGTATAMVFPAGIQFSDADESNIFATCQDYTIATTDYVAGEYVIEDVPLRRVKGTSLTPTLTKCLDQDNFLTSLRVATTILDITPSDLSTVEDLDLDLIEARYAAAIDALGEEDPDIKEISITVSCRHTPVILQALKADAVDAQVNNAIGRIAIVAPVVGTLKADAWDDDDATVCVGNANVSRSDAVVFAWPGHKEYFRELAGTYDVSSDYVIASEISQTAPEESIGQKTTRLTYVSGVETANKSLKTPDYIQMKARGICGIRMNKSLGPQIQSSITSVNPLLDPTLVTIQRRRMSTFISGSLANFAANFKSKKYNVSNYNDLCLGVYSFLSNLKTGERIEDFACDFRTGNTPTRTAQGIVTLIVEVRTLAAMDYIVFKTSIGETVEITVS